MLKYTRTNIYRRECALDFLQNTQIKSLLPQLARRIFIRLKEERNKVEKSEGKCNIDNNDNENDNNNKPIAIDESKQNENAKAKAKSDDNNGNDNSNNDESLSDTVITGQDKSNKNEENEDSINKREQGKDFCAIVTEILSEEEFQCIANHEVYQRKIQHILPRISKRVEMYQNILLQFG